ncbi:unnamed protein product [Chrysoparadoxa australica]
MGWRRARAPPPTVSQKIVALLSARFDAVLSLVYGIVYFSCSCVFALVSAVRAVLQALPVLSYLLYRWDNLSDDVRYTVGGVCAGLLLTWTLLSWNAPGEGDADEGETSDAGRAGSDSESVIVIRKGIPLSPLRLDDVAPCPTETNQLHSTAITEPPSASPSPTKKNRSLLGMSFKSRSHRNKESMDSHSSGKKEQKEKEKKQALESSPSSPSSDGGSSTVKKETKLWG